MISRELALRLIRRSRRDRDLARTPPMGPLVLQAAVAVVVAVGGAVGLYLFLAWLLGVAPHPNGPTSDQQKLLADLVKIALGLAAGVGAAFALVVAYRRARVDEASSHRDDRRLFSSRYQDAADLIGHEKAAVRLAGIYAMTRLADDWAEQRQQCIDVLCAYLRLPYDPGASEPGEREVRLTVIRLITGHLQAAAKRPWRGHDLDFTGAVFDGGDFANAMFSGGIVRFASANFSDGNVNFNGARFSQGTVDFNNAKFSGSDVYFVGAEFSGSDVYFGGSEFSGGHVYFTGAEFSGGHVYFDGAEFSSGGDVLFARAKFSGSTVNFVHATFSGSDVSFIGTEFSGGHVDFTRAGFFSGTTYFAGAKFSSGTVSLIHAAFVGGAVDFAEADFFGGDVDFTRAEFRGGVVNFAGAMFTSGEVNLSGALLQPAGTVPQGLPETPTASLKLPSWMNQCSPDGLSTY